MSTETDWVHLVFKNKSKGHFSFISREEKENAGRCVDQRLDKISKLINSNGSFANDPNFDGSRNRPGKLCCDIVDT